MERIERRALALDVSLAHKTAAELASLCKLTIALQSAPRIAAPEEPSSPNAMALALAAPVSGRDALVVVEAARPLVATLLSSALGRPPIRWAHEATGVPPELAGAWAGLVGTALRRATGHPWRVLAVGLADRIRQDYVALHGDPVVVAGSLATCDETHDVRLWLPPTSDAWAYTRPRSAHALRASLPIRMVAYVAIAVDREVLKALEVGDFLTTPSLTVARSRVLLGTRSSERALTAEFREGVLHFGGESCSSSFDMSEPKAERNAPNDATTQVLTEVPVVVRVELASVELTAAAWSALQPGDVLLTERRVGEQVVLRVGGTEMARGTLVVVEGEVGVRITEVEGP
jgi:flagellar motor switch protein FliN/FliY